jgi:hypothetical protein
VSTRCQILFRESPDDQTPIRIYRHCDGYPDGKHGVPADLARFFAAVRSETLDTRFNDAEYLAAKFVVWQAGENAKAPGSLDFRSLGIAVGPHGDEEFFYRVTCDTTDETETPGVEWQEVGGRWRVAKCDGSDGKSE